MKKVMGLLLLSSLWSGLVEASASKRARIEEPCKVKVEPQVSFAFQGGWENSYPLTSIKNLNTIALLMGDTSGEDTQAIPLDMSLEDFELILLLMNDQETIGTKNEVLNGFLDAADNRLNKMAYLLEKVRFLEPVVTTADGSKTFDSVSFYPLVMAFFNEINGIENAADRDLVLRGLNSESLMLLLDNLLLLAVQDDDMSNSYDQEALRQALALIWKNDYLYGSLSNPQRLLLIDSIKKRSYKIRLQDRTLEQHIKLYLGSDTIDEQGAFPISVQDLIDFEPQKIQMVRRKLYLGRQGLTSLEGLKNVPDVVGNLVDLDVSDNRLTVLDPQLATVPLINLSRNRITSLDKEVLKEFKGVQSLNLSSNRLDYSELKPGMFANCAFLMILNLADNGLHYIQDGVFEGLIRLRKLFLSNNNLRIGRDQRLFANLPSLEELYLRDNGDDHLDIFKLSFSAPLKKLDIVGNNLPPYELDAIRRHLPGCIVSPAADSNIGFW